MAHDTFSIGGLLDEIRENPIMYLGERSITRLYMYEAGYCHALLKHNTREISNTYSPSFNYWVRARLRQDRRSIGWLGSILEACDGDETQAFRRFYELLDEYRSGQFPDIVEQWEAQWDAIWEAKWAAEEEQEARDNNA